LRIAQLGSRHGHAAGKWAALRSRADVEAVGIWEPDATLRERPGFDGATWFTSEEEALNDPTIVAVAVEGRNHESLAMATRAVDAGKHLWFDKPAGDNWQDFAGLLDRVTERGLYLQMGYMFRYSPGFVRIADLARSAVLGHVFAIRAHMSTHIDLVERTEQSRHRGGIMYDLAGHMLDQILWLLGRPRRVQGFLHNHATPQLPGYADNTLAILEFERSLAVIDIAAMEPRPIARRFEVYGTRGSAILEPFDPVRTLRLALEGETLQVFDLPEVPRQELYCRELEAFLRVLRAQSPPDRTLEHERAVQETLLRATGALTA
jgi:predicted dehydrogenase